MGHLETPEAGCLSLWDSWGHMRLDVHHCGTARDPWGWVTITVGQLETQEAGWPSLWDSWRPMKLGDHHCGTAGEYEARWLLPWDSWRPMRLGDHHCGTAGDPWGWVSITVGQLETHETGWPSLWDSWRPMRLAVHHCETDSVHYILHLNLSRFHLSQPLNCLHLLYQCYFCADSTGPKNAKKLKSVDTGGICPQTLAR